MRGKYIGIALAMLMPTAPAMAERTELREKDMTAIDPNAAYVLLTSERAGAMQIFRRARTDEMSDWNFKRAEAYKKAERRYASDLKRFENKEVNVGTGRLYPKPEPVELAFYQKPLELSNFVNIFGRRYIKDQDFILLKLTPGDYVFYTLPGEGAGVKQQGQCLCMGSIGFTAEPGRIVSVGRFSGMVNEREYRFVPAGPNDPIPASLKRLGVKLAQLRAVGKLPNFNGSIVARVGAVPGVLAYARDVPLDSAGQQASGLN